MLVAVVEQMGHNPVYVRENESYTVIEHSATVRAARVSVKTLVWLSEPAHVRQNQVVHVDVHRFSERDPPLHCVSISDANSTGPFKSRYCSARVLWEREDKCGECTDGFVELFSTVEVCKVCEGHG